MKNILDLKEKEVILCKTKEQFIKICEMFHNLGLRWGGGDTYLENDNIYDVFKKETCLYPKKGVYGDLKGYKNSNFTIYKATKFLNNNEMEKRNIELDLNTAKEWYNSENETLKELALQTFPELSKKQHPKRWEDCKPFRGAYILNYTSEIINVSIDKNIESQKFIFKTREQAEASLALAQLSILRDEYRQGWLPDWENNTQLKHCIILKNKKVKLDELYETNCFLSFQTREIAQEFLNNFKELIEQAKPLMS